ncbi:hypothetical protein ACFE04_001694 [Oxalis oulophora]
MGTCPNACHLSQSLEGSSYILVFLVAKDFGARPAYMLALLHPEKVSAIITLGVPYVPPTPPKFTKLLPEEADFGRFDAKTVVRNVYILFSRSELPIALENQEIMDLVNSETPLPPWFTEEDLQTYGDLYEKSGFETALQVPYRAIINEEYGITDFTVKVPVLLIMGEKDYTLRFPGMKDYIGSEKMKQLVPDLDIIHLPEGTHFLQEQFPDRVNQLILDFLKRHV